MRSERGIAVPRARRCLPLALVGVALAVAAGLGLLSYRSQSTGESAEVDAGRAAGGGTGPAGVVPTRWEGESALLEEPGRRYWFWQWPAPWASWPIAPGLPAGAAAGRSW